jgi:thiamine-phosphate pyrophosphorylase
VILHVVTDAVRRVGSGDPGAVRGYLIALARGAVRAGIDHFQVREPEIPARDLESVVREIVRVADGTMTRVLVNDRLDVAIGAGAAGVHLKESSIPVARARGMAPAGFLIGRSIHTVPASADVTGADYLIAGTVWPTASKPETQPTIGPSGLSDIVAGSALPVLAVGGVTLERLRDVARSGAAGVAAIGLFAAVAPERLRDLAHELRQRFDTLA